MPRLRLDTPQARIRWRHRGGALRAYLDVRDFADVTTKCQPALIPKDGSLATTDPQEAERLAAAHLDELRRRRELKPSLGPAERTLERFATLHLIKKQEEASQEPAWLEQAARHLGAARDFFGADKDLGSIRPLDIRRYAQHLKGRANSRGGTLASGTVAQYLNSLSNMFSSAIEEELLPMGTNPVSAWKGKPKVINAAANWLQIEEVAGVLEWVRGFVPARPDLTVPFLYPLVALLALTGFRLREALGLRRVDVQLGQRSIVVEANQWRRLKNAQSRRHALIFTQLFEILAAYQAGPHAPTGDLYFPAFDADGLEVMIGDIDKILDQCPMPSRLTRPLTPSEEKIWIVSRNTRAAAMRRRALKEAARSGRTALSTRKLATIEKAASEAAPKSTTPPLRAKMLRHSYCAARIQTTVRGLPITLFEVARDMGHKDTQMINDVYGHLQRRPHRGEEVEYVREPLSVQGDLT